MEEQKSIPFNVVGAIGREQSYVTQAIAGGHLSGDGPFTQKCHELLKNELQVSKAFLTTPLCL
jgi:dTDP-4-amino-4,6-dideoxygalactose transaminase